MTTGEWRDFLQRWSDKWFATGSKFPTRIKKRQWLGNKPATGTQLIHLEKRLGYQLPPSYRNFLLITNGWSQTSSCVQTLRPARSVEWLEVDNPQLLDIWSGNDQIERSSDYSSLEYFSYDGRPIFDVEHFRKSLVIADPVAGDSMIYVLNPKVVASDGEWEAWRFANWIPGAEREI